MLTIDKVVNRDRLLVMKCEIFLQDVLKRSIRYDTNTSYMVGTYWKNDYQRFLLAQHIDTHISSVVLTVSLLATYLGE